MLYSFHSPSLGPVRLGLFLAEMVPGEDLAIQITQPFLVGLVRGLESLGTERGLSEMICRSPYVFEKKIMKFPCFIRTN